MRAATLLEHGSRGKIFGHFPCAGGRNSTDFGRMGPNAPTPPNLVQIWRATRPNTPTPANVVQIWPSFGSSGPQYDEVWPTSVEIGRIFAGASPKSVQARPIWTSFRRSWGCLSVLGFWAKVYAQGLGEWGRQDHREKRACRGDPLTSPVFDDPLDDAACRRDARRPGSRPTRRPHRPGPFAALWGSRDFTQTGGRLPATGDTSIC